MQQFSFFIGPKRTPNAVKLLIFLTVAASLLTPLVSYWMEHFFYLPGPSAWLSLSLFGLQKGWLWQPATYFFLHSAGMGIHFSLLINLFFNMILLWFAGSEFTFRFGKRNFILFYLGGGVVAGLVSALLLFLFSSQVVLVGSTPPLFALIMVWTMMYPELELSFFFLIRIKAKWLTALLLCLSLLMNLSAGAWVSFFADFIGILWGFSLGRLIWKFPNPYPLHLDRSPWRKKTTYPEDKIIDITALHEEDDAFMDRMLEKIAARGKESLTPREQQRMKKISERKSQR